MENLRLPSSWSCYYQGKSLEELKHSLLCTTLELETTRLAAQEEICRKDEEIKQLRDLLNRAIRDREEINDKYQGLLLQQQLQPGLVVLDDDRRSEESIVCGSPVQSMETIGPLPEKGKLLQAVMKAGPLLQTLLLAGPLPQWRHPPPPLDTIEIPPVAISVDTATGNVDRSLSSNGRKRSLIACQGTDGDFSPLTPPSVRRQSEGVFSVSHATTLFN